MSASDHDFSAVPAETAPGSGAAQDSASAVTPFRFVPLDDFVAVDEPGADPIIGSPGNVVVPEAGDVMIFGDGGAGKTTIEIDLAFHLAAGDDWCGLAVPQPVRVALVENEGPRPLFRDKLRRKREAWAGSPVDDRLHVLEHPWACFTFADEAHRVWLADAVAALELAIVFLGPLTRIGMNEAGTLQQTRDFTALLADVRARTPRPVTFSVTHHENKAGEVSGAWEGAGDTLLHVTGQGHGRTKLHVRKARWSSEWHGKSLDLVWADGEGYAVDTQPDRDDNVIADKIIATARANGGKSWNTIEKAVGGNAAQARRIRDRLLQGGRLADTNAEKSTKIMALWDAEDPLRPARLDADAPLDAPGGEGDGSSSASTASALKEDAVADADAPAPPAADDLEWK